MKTVEMNTIGPKKNNCPSCGATLDQATQASDLDEVRVPSEDDLTICVYCASVCRFTASLDLTLASDELIGSLDPDVRRILERTVELLKKQIARRAQGMS